MFPFRGPQFHQPVTDLGVPNYDRSRYVGNYVTVSLADGTVVFSAFCPNYAQALAMSRLSKREPTWVIGGLEKELLILKRLISIKAEWLTPEMLDNLMKSQLGRSLRILATFNLKN